MSESEIYEDAQSKIISRSKNNTFSNYQESYKEPNKLSNKMISKGNESSIYQDAQSKITNNSCYNYNYKNSFIKKNNERSDIELKNEFLKNNNMYINEKNVEINNFKNLNEKENYEKEDDIYNNENDKGDKSEYSEPDGGNIFRNETLFEGSSQKGGCCNLPKCFIF